MAQVIKKAFDIAVVAAIAASVLGFGFSAIAGGTDTTGADAHNAPVASFQQALASAQ